MKLGLFNRWKPLGTMYGLELEYQTTTAKGAGKVYVTYVKDKKSGATVTRNYGRDADSALQNTISLLKRIGPEKIHQAIESGQPVLAASPQPEQKEVDWRDGSNHSYRAQRRLVGEQVEEEKEKPVIRNFVAKHARSVNKAGPMKDKKNDYKRKPKHKKEVVEGND